MANSKCLHGVVGPSLASLPYLIRAVQCYRTYIETSRPHHLVNLGKYLSSFPVIWTSALKHQLAPVEGVLLDRHDQYLQVLWLYTVTINTLYSYLWDVLMDWGLCRSPNAKHVLLRDDLIFRHPVLYYAAMIADLALRLCWSLKLSSHLQQHASGSELILCHHVPYFCNSTFFPMYNYNKYYSFLKQFQFYILVVMIITKFSRSANKIQNRNENISSGLSICNSDLWSFLIY